MKALQFIVVLAAALSCVRGIMQGVGWSTSGAFVGFVVFLAWFVLLRRRSLLAWYLGCAIFTVILVQVVVFQALLPFFAEPTTGFGWWMLISQGLFAMYHLSLADKVVDSTKARSHANRLTRRWSERRTARTLHF